LKIPDTEPTISPTVRAAARDRVRHEALSSRIRRDRVAEIDFAEVGANRPCSVIDGKFSDTRVPDKLSERIDASGIDLGYVCSTDEQSFVAEASAGVRAILNRDKGNNSKKSKRESGAKEMIETVCGGSQAPPPTGVYGDSFGKLSHPPPLLISISRGVYMVILGAV
jgi:hypothetical protein